MAYNVKEKQIELITVPKNNRGDFIRAARIVPEDETKQQSVDIRNLYTNSDGELTMTQKGVRIASEHLPSMMAMIVANMTDEEREKFNKILEVNDKLKSEEQVKLDDNQ